MTAAYFEDHPTDPNKVILRKRPCPYCNDTPRTWVGLTDEEIKDCFKITPDQHLPWHIYQRIEAKLKEKNDV